MKQACTYHKGTRDIRRVQSVVVRSVVCGVGTQAKAIAMRPFPRNLNSTALTRLGVHPRVLVHQASFPGFFRRASPQLVKPRAMRRELYQQKTKTAAAEPNVLA